MSREYLRLSEKNVPLEELERLTLGSLRRAVFEGDLDTGSFMAGQVAGLVKSIRPIKTVIEDLFDLEQLKREIAAL
jgi:enoyl-[acyl-carrier protein] reductase II